MAATGVFLAIVVIVPAMMNLVCLLVLVRKICKRWKEGGQSQEETATLPEIKVDEECPQAQHFIHMIVLQPDQQVVFGKKVILESSAQEQQDQETAETLEKAVVQGNDASSYTFWVTSLPQQPDASINADL